MPAPRPPLGPQGPRIGPPAIANHPPLLCPKCGSESRESLVCVEDPSGAVTVCRNKACGAVLAFANAVLFFEALSDLGLDANQALQVSVVRDALRQMPTTPTPAGF